MLVNDTYLDAKQELTFKKVSRLLQLFATAAEEINPGATEAAIASAILVEVTKPAYLEFIRDHDCYLIDGLLGSMILAEMRRQKCLRP